jgi:DNA-binding MarR family transcriptional regulator
MQSLRMRPSLARMGRLGFAVRTRAFLRAIFFLTNVINLVNIDIMDRRYHERIMDMIYKAHLYLQKLESTPRDYGTGDLLYSSDIHTIVAVSRSPGCNLTQLAALLSISKAAVSKFAAKLLRMGYLAKSRRMDNDREVIFNLTKKGQAAVRGHEAFEAKTFGPLFEIESNLSDRDYQVIMEYFRKMSIAVET